MSFLQNNDSTILYLIQELKKIFVQKKDIASLIPEVPDAGPRFDQIYPVGSVYISSTNTDPSSDFGGTWELVDKEFKQRLATNVEDFVTLDSNCSEITGSVIWRQHSITLTVTYTPAVEITDTALTMLTLNLTALGISRFTQNLTFSQFVDSGQAVIAYILSTNGVLTTRDVMVRGSSAASLGTGYTPTFTMDFPVSSEYMFDEFCDKFYWKRTA